MNRSLSWIDGTRWRKLVKSVRRSEPPVSDYGQEGFLSLDSLKSFGTLETNKSDGSSRPSVEPSKVADKVRSVPPRSDEAGVTEKPPGSGHEAEVVRVVADLDLSGPLETRIAAFLDWVDQTTVCSAVYLADEDGLALAQHKCRPAHISLSALILRFQADLRRWFGVSRRGIASINLDDEFTLYCIECTTRWGQMALGIVLRESLPQQTLRKIQHELEQVFTEKGV